MYAEEELVAQCLEAGAAGYVLKDVPAAQLVYAIQVVARGGRYLSPKRSRAWWSATPRAPRTGDALRPPHRP